MTSRVLAEGNGAAGAVGYVTHDAPIDGRPQKTSKRVVGVAVRGVPLGCPPELVARIMQSTITDAPWRKQRAGIKPGSRKLKYGVVHIGLGLPLGQHPTWEEMEAAGDSWLAANGLQDHYCVMAAHRESGKPDHLHLIICRIDSETGRAHRGNLATTGSRWAEEYERNHGGIQIPTRVERNRIRAELRRLKQETQEAQEKGPTLIDRVRRLVGAPDTVERIGRQIVDLKGKMPPIEPTRSAGLHRQRADAESQPIWDQLLTAQRKEREALAEKGPQQEVDQLELEQGLSRRELDRRLKRGEDIVDPPRTRVPAAPVRTRVRPPRHGVVVAADPAEHARTTEWFRENRPEPAFGRQLAAAGYTPRRLEDALGPELAPPWAMAMRQHIARRERPKDFSMLFEPGADPVQRELQQEWLQLHEPTEANAEALLAAGRSLPALEDVLGRETARRYIAAAPRPDISMLFEPGADPVQRELQQEWLQLHEPTEANAEALLAAGRSLPALEDALGRETARRYIAAAPRPDINTLFERGAGAGQRELTKVWLQLHEPTEANAQAILLAAGRSLPALEDALGRETARRYVAAAPPPDISALFERGAGAGQRELTKVWLQLHEPTEANAQAILLAAGRSLPALEDALGQETARRYVAAAPPPDNDELHAAWDDPAQHSLLQEWCRLTEPTPKILRQMVADRTNPTLLGDVLDGPATLSETEWTAGVRAGDTWEEPLRQQYHAEGVDPGGRAPLSPQRALGVQRYQRGTPAERQQALGDAEERQFATLAQIHGAYAARRPARNAARAAATPPKQRHKPKARQQPAAVRTPATSAAPRSTTRSKRRGPAEKQPDQQPAAAVRTAPAMPKQPPTTPPSRPERPAANPIPAAFRT